MLARCDTFLHVTSNIATAVGYMNPKLAMRYAETPLEAASVRMQPILTDIRARTNAVRVDLELRYREFRRAISSGPLGPSLRAIKRLLHLVFRRRPRGS
jgi:hypothetical protein